MTYSANYPCIIQITSFDNVDVVDSWGTEVEVYPTPIALPLNIAFHHQGDYTNEWST